MGAISETAPITRKLANAVHQLVEETAAQAGEVERRVRDRAQRTREQACETATSVPRATLRGVGDYTQKHPSSALAIAFGAGILMAGMVRR